MNWNIIKTEAGYNTALKRTMKIFHAEEGSPEADKLALLLVLVKDYEYKNIHLSEADIYETNKHRIKKNHKTLQY